MKKYYTKDEIKGMLLRERPWLTESEIEETAKVIHRGLNTLDIGWKRKNKRFHEVTISYEQYFEREYEEIY